MNDKITENILNDEDENHTTESSAATGTFSRTQALTAVGIAIGMWAMLGITAGWSEPLFPTGLSPLVAITTTAAWTSMTVAGIVACRLPFVPDLRDGLWEILTLWAIMVFGGGALVGIVLWGPPIFEELLRGGQA